MDDMDAQTIIALVVVTLIIGFWLYSAGRQCFQGSYSYAAQPRRIISNNGINVIQTWKSKTNIPGKYSDMQQSVQNLPDINYIFFDDEAIYQFVYEFYPEYKEFFDALPTMIQKLDFWRYLAIYRLGGLYLDLDMQVTADRISDEQLAEWGVCAFPLEFEQNSDLVLQNRGCQYLIGNYAFYAEAQHPFLQELITQIATDKFGFLRDPSGLNEHQKVYFSTGPVCCTLAYLDTNTNVNVISPSPFQNSCFGNFAVHMNSGSWKE